MEHFNKAIELHKRHARISFKEISETDTEIIVKVWQNRSPSENYSDKERLTEIVKELYALRNERKTLIIHATPYVEAPAEIVNPEWIKQQMHKLKKGSKVLIADLGIAKAELSALINGHREMGIRTKGLFYYYFKSLN
jgi:hypothetical protein